MHLFSTTSFTYLFSYINAITEQYLPHRTISSLEPHERIWSNSLQEIIIKKYKNSIYELDIDSRHHDPSIQTLVNVENDFRELILLCKKMNLEQCYMCLYIYTPVTLALVTKEIRKLWPITLSNIRSIQLDIGNCWI